jgi:Amt family ammonium transporter
MQYSSVDTIWVLLGAVLVFFMQAGFAMVETGFTRAKNAGNIIMKNLMDFCIGSLAFWFIGFGLMFGIGGNLFVGGLDFFVKGDYGVAGSYPSMAFLIFQTVFCATAATIVSGAMAERTKFSSYCIYSLIISAIIYPISGHWIWGGGFLSEMGFHDFAGSTAVHMVGGVAAIIGAKILGPRIGKYDKDGNAKAIPGHSLTLGALGVFILWFSWFGFNGCSTVSMTGDAIIAASSIFVNTNLAAAASTVIAMLYTSFKYKKPDISMSLNAALAGLVAITAGCDVVTPTGAVMIGIIVGFVVVMVIEFVEKVLKIDDPVGAFAVHGVCGALGTILTGIFSTSQGVLYGKGLSFLGVQILGVAIVCVWVVVSMTIIFTLINKTVGLRVTEEEEIIGLDVNEHGLDSSYADFMPNISSSSYENLTDIISNSLDKEVPEDVAIPVVNHKKAKDSDERKITMVSIIFNQNKFEVLKNALNDIGITGLTATQVIGCGTQKGNTQFYRGVALGMNLFPKIKVDIVISKIPVRTIIEISKKVLYTGKIGDGKIFVYDVENVVKIRTAEEGFDALQDSPQ